MTSLFDLPCVLRGDDGWCTHYGEHQWGGADVWKMIKPEMTLDEFRQRLRRAAYTNTALTSAE